MKFHIESTALVLGDSIDTDQISPGRFLELTDPKEIGKLCFSGLDESIAPNFPNGGIVVAGKNFGCGSSREHAPIALINMGASIVLADSFARIFYRNGINLGLPLVVCKGLSQSVESDDLLFVDLQSARVTNRRTEKVYPCEKISDYAGQILSAGGIKPLMRKRHANNK
jgi:3-isopropylmalate dehydratase small subunit